MGDSVKQRGRPRAFDETEVLHKALLLFWSKGYEGTSIADLTETLGLNKPSLYAAFGNKKELFRKALAKYIAGPVRYAREALSAATARETVAMLLMQSAEFLTSPDLPRGCLLVHGALSCGESGREVQQELIRHRLAFEEALRDRFEDAKGQGEFNEDFDAAAMAKYIATVHQGMSVQAIGGASRDELVAVAETVLKHWP